MAVSGGKSGALRITVLEQLGDREWDAAVAACGRSFRFSHRSAAGRALERSDQSYEYMPSRVQYSDGSSILFALVRVKRRVGAASMVLGMPLGLEGTPLCANGTVAGSHLEALFAELDDCGLLELYGGAGGSPPQLANSAPMVTHTLDLTQGFEALWTGSFTAKNRNMCRKAERGGVTVARDSSQQAAHAYAELHARNAQGWETPAAARGALIEALMSTGETELWLARLGELVVGGALLLRGSDDLLYWSGAMDRDHRDVAPSNAVLRAALESACERGLKYFDFGSSAGLPGVEAFKRSFGASPSEYSAVSLSSWRYRQFELARRRMSGARAGR